jgi:hypothetical protein
MASVEGPMSRPTVSLPIGCLWLLGGDPLQRQLHEVALARLIGPLGTSAGGLAQLWRALAEELSRWKTSGD